MRKKWEPLYKGYINYTLDGKLKTHHFEKKTFDEVEELKKRFSSIYYDYKGIQVIEDKSGPQI